MVFITVVSSKRILRKLDWRKLNLEGEVYDRPIYFFNKKEEQSLLAYKEFLVNPERFVKDVYQKVKIEDSYRYVYEGKASCYHKAEDCKRLNVEFCNFRTPEEIRNRGIEMVQRFRIWLENNRHLFEGKEDVFEICINATFHMRLKIEEIAPLKNSGTTTMNNWAQEELKSKINERLKQAGKHHYQPPKNTATLKQYGKLAYLGNSPNQIIDSRMGYSDTEVKTSLCDYKEKFKRPIIAMLYDYYRMKLNPELALDVRLLEQSGFRACHSCFF